MKLGLDLEGWSEAEAVLTYADTLRELGRLSQVVAAARRVPAGPLAHFAALLTGWATQALDGPSAALPWFQAASDDEPGNVLYAYLVFQAKAASGAGGHFAWQSFLETSEEAFLTALHPAQWHLDPPSLAALNDKVGLHDIIQAASGDVLDFWPEGYVLPRCAPEVSQAAARESSTDAAEVRWVRKRRHAMGGKGVSLHASAAEGLAEAASEAAAAGAGEAEELFQAYVRPPVLLEGRKFSLRLWLVVYDATEEPMVGYLAEPCLVLLAPEPYATAGWAPAGPAAESPGERQREAGRPAGGPAGGGRRRHITNQSALLVEGGPGAEPLTRDREYLRRGLEQAFPSLDFAGLWSSIQELAGALLRASSCALARAVGEFRPGRAPLVPKILGLDVLLSVAAAGGAAGRPGGGRGGGAPNCVAKPWLLEVNRHPSLGELVPCARAAKRAVVKDAWTLLWLPSSGWPPRHGCLRRVR